MIWTTARINRLRDLVAAGGTSITIAKAMGISRSAVMGKIHREGIRLKGLPGHKLRQRGSQKASEAPPAPKSAPRPPMGPPPLEGRLGAGPAVYALEPHHCRWPIGSVTGEDFHFCAEPRNPTVNPPYCRKHTAAAGSTHLARGWLR